MRIVSYEPGYSGDFIRLNRAWIEERFRLEQADVDLFSDVDGRVAAGAVILLAEEDGSIVGTCMGTPLGDDVWEVEKVATDPAYRRRGIATSLLRACLDEIELRGGRKAVILTNSSLADAIKIYRREGFRDVPVDPSWDYERVDVQLEAQLTPRGTSSGRPS